MEDELSGSTDTLSNNSVGITDLQNVYVTFAVIVFRLASTMFIIGMANMIISTILQTRSLHNIHNILIGNLMVADIVTAIAYTFQTTGMMISYIIGIQDPFRCDVLYFTLFPIIIIMYTFVMLSVEKFIAIKYALRYKAIVTHRRVYQAIATSWIIALLFRFMRLAYELIVGSEYDKSPQFGSCSIKQRSALITVFTTIIPLLFAFLITIILDTYLSIKAYQIYKRIHEENGERVQIFNAKLKKTLQHLKPMITLLVTILGSLAISIISSIISASATMLMAENKSWQIYVRHVFLSNTGLLTLIVHQLVYSLYFKQIRQPLCRKFKRMARRFKLTNTVSPSQAHNVRSIRRAWM